ncbi:hypothetical protein [Flavitalea sp.]|nr:hypothetical protein [Flavitalea sp.]
MNDKRKFGAEQQSFKGITVKQLVSGDILIRLHREELIHSLDSADTEDNGTILLGAIKRTLKSDKGHTHAIPVALPKRSKEPMAD